MRPCDRHPTSPSSHPPRGGTGTHPPSFHHPRPHPPHTPITPRILGAKLLRNCAMARGGGEVIIAASRLTPHRPSAMTCPARRSPVETDTDTLVEDYPLPLADGGWGSDSNDSHAFATDCLPRIISSLSSIRRIYHPSVHLRNNRVVTTGKTADHVVVGRYNYSTLRYNKTQYDTRNPSSPWRGAHRKRTHLHHLQGAERRK